MHKHYEPGNEFLTTITIADAAVEWEQIPEEEFSNVFINDEGYPYHPKYPKLVKRAEALHIAAIYRKIDALTYNAEADMRLPVCLITLERDSVAAFIKATEKRMNARKPLRQSADEVDGKILIQEERLLNIKEVMALVGISKSSIYAKIEKKLFPKQSHENSARWRYSDIVAYMTNKSIDNAKSSSQKAKEEEGDI